MISIERGGGDPLKIRLTRNEKYESLKEKRSHSLIRERLSMGKKGNKKQKKHKIRLEGGKSAVVLKKRGSSN